MKFIHILGKSLHSARSHQTPYLAASLSFYTMLSIAPLLILLLSIVGLLIDPAVAREQIFAQIRITLDPGAAEAIQGMLASIENAQHSVLATIIGFVVLLFGATRVLAQLRFALNTIWGMEEVPGHEIRRFFTRKLFSFGLILTIGFLLVISLVVSALASYLVIVFSTYVPLVAQVLPWIDTILSIVLVTVLFALLFKYLPDAIVDWRDVWVGALITAVLFTIGKLLIGFYIAQSGVASAYGVAGSVVILLLWVYYSAQIFFIGAEITHQYAHEYGSRILPKDGARMHTACPRWLAWVCSVCRKP